MVSAPSLLEIWDEDDDRAQECDVCGEGPDLCECHEGESCGRWDQSAPGGMWPVHMCRLAGTEQCDFDCPYRND